MAGTRTRRVVAQPYPSEARSKPALNLDKAQITGRISKPGFCVPWGLSNMAASEGDNVSETRSEIAVAAVMVTANWR